MTCYKGGETVFNNHQMCDVTSAYTSSPWLCCAALLTRFLDRKILDMLPDRPPQVTFSCEKDTESCHFQFWTAQVESFYCELQECSSRIEHGYDKNSTYYDCDKIQCKCVPGRFICGEDGSLGEHTSCIG